MPEPVPPANRDSGPLSPPRRMAGAALLLSLATLLSRVLGLVREQVFAALLGAGFYGDAFTTAFRLPNLLRDLFAEGALSAAFQPAFQAARKNEGLVASMHDELAALRKVGGQSAVDLVRHQPDPKVIALVRTWAARFETRRALDMGFVADASFDDIVRAYVEDNPSAVKLRA